MSFCVQRVKLPVQGQSERAVQYRVIGVLRPAKKGKVYFSSCYPTDAVEAIKKLLATDNPKPLDAFLNETDDSTYPDHWPHHD